jgi:hypothetical protein
MSADRLLSELQLGDERLALFAWRLAHSGEGVSETIPLVQLASVRIAFEREGGKLGGAIGCGAGALVLFLISSPLNRWLAGLAAKVVTEKRDSLELLLHSVLSALAGIAAALPMLALALLAAGAALAALWWYGRTTLTLSFAATGRSFSARGKHAGLMEFSEALSARLDSLTRPGAA